MQVLPQRHRICVLAQRPSVSCCLHQVLPKAFRTWWVLSQGSWAEGSLTRQPPLWAGVLPLLVFKGSAALLLQTWCSAVPPGVLFPWSNSTWVLFCFPWEELNSANTEMIHTYGRGKGEPEPCHLLLTLVVGLRDLEVVSLASRAEISEGVVWFASD